MQQLLNSYAQTLSACYGGEIIYWDFIYNWLIPILLGLFVSCVYNGHISQILISLPTSPTPPASPLMVLVYPETLGGGR